MCARVAHTCVLERRVRGVQEGSGEVLAHGRTSGHLATQSAYRPYNVMVLRDIYMCVCVRGAYPREEKTSEERRRGGERYMYD